MEFWWYVLIAVLALAVAESLLGNRHLTADGEVKLRVVAHGSSVQAGELQFAVPAEHMEAE